MKHLNHRTKFREGEKRISLGALSGVLVAFTSFLGYLIAYGWRIGEARFYGIEQGLISVSLEDGLRYSVPIVLIFVCVIVVFGVDQDEEEEAEKSRKTKWVVFGVALLAFVVDVVAFGVFANNRQSFPTVLTLIIGIILVIVVFVSLVLIVLNKKTSIGALVAITLAYLVEIFCNNSTVSAIAIAGLSFALLIYLGIEGRLSANRIIAPIKSSLVIPFSVIGVALLGCVFLCSMSMGYYVAGRQQHIVLDSDEVVLATYNSDRSIMGTIDEQGNIVAYRVGNLSDESQSWTVQEVTIKGNSLF